MRAGVFASIAALSLLGSASIGQAQIPGLPGIPGIPGIPSVLGSNNTAHPPLQPFTGDLKGLTGSVPTTVALRGVYAMTAEESKTPIANITVRDFTSVATLRFFNNGNYELIYRAHWGPAQTPTASGFNGIEINEQGRFSLSSAVLLLEPARTTNVRTTNGVAGAQATIDSERRAYIARVTTSVSGIKITTQSITLIGRCPEYQLDSACQHGKTVRYFFVPEVVVPKRR